MTLTSNNQPKNQWQDWLKFFFQNLLSPILLLGMGVYMDRKLDEQKHDLEKIKIANEIIDQAYSGNSEKAFALDRMMRAFLDQEIADSVSDIISTYINSKANAIIVEAQNDPKKLEELVNTESSAQTIGGSAANTVIKKLGKDTRYQDLKHKLQTASALEKKGIQQLKNGQIDSSINSFKAADSIYPTIHNAYEISNLMLQNKNQLLNSPAVQAAFIDTIKKKYSWGIKDEIQK